MVFSISFGILQEKYLSPLLCALILSDIETYLRSRGALGINVGITADLLMLLYIDYLMVLAKVDLV